MPKVLTRLRIDEVSAVDRGAGEGVKILLMKRDEPRKTKREDIMSKFLDFFKGKSAARIDQVLQKATDALAKSVGVINTSDDSEEDKQKALADTFAEFDDYMQKHVTVSPDPVPDKTKETPPMLKELAKALGLKEDASEADVVKAVADRDAQIELLKAGLTDDEKSFHDKIGKADDQTSFRKLDHDGRKKLMTKSDDLPEYVRKLISDGAEATARVAKLEEAQEIAKYERIARENGVPTAEAASLMKLAKADQASLDRLLAHTKAGWAAAEKAGVFSEIGTTGGNGRDDTAQGELMAKAEELRKANPALTKEQAFAKVFTDPANIELAKRERAESASPIINPPGTMR